MYLQKVLSRKNCVKKIVFAGILKVNDENSRIRIHSSEAWICGSGSGSTPKCHGSATLQKKARHKYIVRHSTTLSYPPIENSFNGCQGHPLVCLPPKTAQRQRSPEVKRFERAAVYSANTCRQL